jgi:hypothetical protein
MPELVGWYVYGDFERPHLGVNTADDATMFAHRCGPPISSLPSSGRELLPTFANAHAFNAASRRVPAKESPATLHISLSGGVMSTNPKDFRPWPARVLTRRFVAYQRIGGQSSIVRRQRQRHRARVCRCRAEEHRRP